MIAMSSTPPSSRVPVTVSARVGAMIVSAAAQRGADASALMAAAGFDPTWLHDPDARMPLAVEHRLWEGAALRTGDACFGLRTAARIRPGVFQVLDYAVRTAPDLHTALLRLARYNRLVHDVAQFDIVAQGETVRIEHRFGGGADVRPCRHATEFTLASLVVVASQISGTPVAARAVAFAHAWPGDESAYRAVFGVRPCFDAPVSCVVLDADVLRRPIPTADPELSRIVTAHAERLLALWEPAAATLRARVRRELVQGLGRGAWSLAHVARALGMSERTLQRRLRAEGIGFTDLLDEVRRELAHQYLANRQLALGEIAFLLGFSEPSALHRAFKRWTGMTPSAARRQVL